MDNEDQNLLPNLPLTTLYRIWQDRQDWFFAVDLGLIISPRQRIKIS